jgi:hypothetical protein
LLTASSFAQADNEWIIKQPTKLYPVDVSTTATLKSTSEPSASLVISVKPEHISLPKPHDSTSLSMYLDVGDASFQLEPARWGKAGMANPAGVKVLVIFDNEKPVADLWEAGSGAAFVTDNTSCKFTKVQFLDRLQTAKTLVILYTLREGVSKSAAFDLSEAPKAISDLIAAGGPSQENLPNYRISSDTIAVGKAIFSLVPEVADPKTHDSAVAKLDQVKALIKDEAPDSDADAAALNDFLSLYTFATYLYDTRDHWIRLDPQIKAHPQNLLLLRPYSDCWQKVHGELETGVVLGAGNVACDLTVIGEH